MWLPRHTCAGRQKRIFSDEEEVALVSFVRDNFTASGLILIDSNFREIAMNVFSTLSTTVVARNLQTGLCSGTE
jgi:hypothetical protein